ncbi:MAG: aminoacyl--tRNA ligase-related protein, partial [Acidimicrobiales bacterium]
VTWQAATDPFFRPAANPRYVMQVVDPTKHELVFAGSGGDLALASVNLHHDHFGRAFDIRMGTAPAHTGCLAFGLERWLAAIIRHHGPDPSAWPA